MNRNRKYAVRVLLIVCSVLFLCAPESSGQQYDCSSSYPVFKIDFGDAVKPVEMQLAYTRSFYNRIQGQCPDDGEYSFVPAVTNCFNGNWYTVLKDHTPGSNNGRMMLVNAAKKPAPFFTYLITGLKDNAPYTFSAWFLNVCRPWAECTSALPQIRCSITDKGKLLASVLSGKIPKAGPEGWQQITGSFTLPAGTTSCLIFMESEAAGGCGNDFAMDDIEVRMCKPVSPVPAVQPKPQPELVQPAARPPVMRPQPPRLKKNTGVAVAQPVKTTVIKPVTIPPPAINTVPLLLQTRTNTVAKEIETTAEELEISLYDNGDIDGDTVSVFHNNIPLLLHQRLSDKAIRFKVNVHPAAPHHELVLVADNLGSIPPNTSVMIVSSKSSRWQVSLSASEKQNAKVVIDLKKE